MNILLLGNGFDLHFKLPTKYINFIHVIDFLLTYKDVEVKTVGDVFGKKSLHEMDSWIKESYDLYRQEYDSTSVDLDIVEKIICHAKKNYWISYLRSSCNKDVKWIDFEKEIGRVLESFKLLLSESEKKYIKSEKLSKADRYILTVFGFWYDEHQTKSSGIWNRLYANADYVVESPPKSGNLILNTEAVISTLIEEANELTEIMRLYMHQFIDMPLERISSRTDINRVSIYFNAECPITLNYTHTYERIFQKKAIHLHGSTSDKIILGINPNSDDELETIDTTFVSFKKYYQRVEYNTDIEYLLELSKISKMGERTKKNLIIFGHSLDETDKDIIADLFEIADLIMVFYYSKNTLASQITNLIKIFGRERFSFLRRKKLLRFYHISSIKDIKAFEDVMISTEIEEAFDEEQ